MSSTMQPTTMQTAQVQLPALPLTIEGTSVLHTMLHFRWTEWRKLGEPARAELVKEASLALEQMTHNSDGQSALFSLLGHKADLLLLHFRNSFDQLKAAELHLAQLRLSDFLEPATSYLSVVELGLYESTVKLYRELVEKGIAPHSPEWNRETEQVLQRQREAMRPRLYPDIPPARYLCFYPMDRRRGEEKNWYTLPIEERQRQMEEHGMVGRRYAGTVKQIITGSIGFDDWEWGVDLFSDDPLVFKRLIYEMRFDEVSAVYALFGTFYVGVRCPVSGLGRLLSGELPALK
ncbi:MAG TPA: hydrogen peroxide-dependent heme synthase [Terriglobales bacterium]|jgi:peroxiredoxin|nr:hydrogen peroxide-dependent heme synthase [Terriglobales bacterium]